ncbi:UV DNA damage endonuclease [Clostridium beijerinckii]|uniref:UV DNA damage repair endonuclease UvsE n=1 Tax=Clostridium beijerinckii TaxID=1520 RepID=UPI00156FA58A|nr:UV DNA damage repair endonuclease UvsE [Clostridium beijerinckii]NRT37240.1 UV DNA damage endonuclease [Clostridium beijerinckii]NRT43326.1 UV DNA damage endonuclease [Clostridium beijerinckii]NRZ22684.1 UV DNA damage endonuclease [Clostridium beijerinckii]
MSIGYACLTIGVPDTNLKSCTAKSLTEEKLLEIISYNLKSLKNIIEYNIKNNIKLFRISSDLIPFGSSHLNQLSWWNIFSQEFAEIGRKIMDNDIRVSMHPGQYTVLNSPNDDVVKRAIEDLNYHVKVLDNFGVGANHKIILHIGGVYNDKEQAINRFADNYKRLNDQVKERLVIENDDKSYNINDVLKIGNEINIPVVFDNLHNDINCYDREKSDSYWISECNKTWKEKDGRQKIHYSQQDPLKKAGSHSNTIKISKFIEFYESLKGQDIDIMLEVKDKNLSAVKCINSIDENSKIKKLEEEWGRYKYKVLENSPSNYLEIRKLLKDKTQYPSVEFYNYIEDAMEEEITIGNSINTALHVWGYFKNLADDKEKMNFLKSIEDYKNGKVSIKLIKNKLFKMAVKYNESYLLNSYYFL